MTVEAKERTRLKYNDSQLQALRLIGSGPTRIMLFGGAGSGKTFTLISFIVFAIHKIPGMRTVILRKHFKDVKESIAFGTFHEVMKQQFGISRYQVERRINKAHFFYTAPNGSELWFGGLDDKGRMENILGKEYSLIYFNECSQIGYDAYQTAIARLRQKVPGWKNRALFDCNPPSTSHWVYKVFIKGLNPDRTELKRPELYTSMKLNPEDNSENLGQDYIDDLKSLNGRAYKRFYCGEFTNDNENALWARSTMIDPFRVLEAPNDLDRIVIGVDPAVTANKNSDLTGIVVCGAREESDGKIHYYVLEDQSGIYTPKEWTTIVNACYHKWHANEVVVEVNQGGQLVTEALRNANYQLPIKAVRAANGKTTRAEPIAVLYSNGQTHHVNELNELEDELTSYTGQIGEKSPDRMDALVWAMTELSENSKTEIGSFSFF